MKNMTCIVCPNGCSLQVEVTDGEIKVQGNRCERGRKFAVTEMTAPMRTICSIVRTDFKDAPVVPVKVSGEIPKERIFEVMKEINKVKVDKPLGTGDVVIENVLGLGVDVVITSDLLKGEKENE